MIKRVYLVIGADKSVRAAYRPRIGLDEVAIPVTLNFPDGWGRVSRNELIADVPDFAPEAALAEDGDAPDE